MRVTQKLMMDNAIHYMDDNLQRLNSLQEKVASGKQFQRPSDNPSGVAAVLGLRSTLETSQAFLNTAQVTNDWMSSTDFSLGQMSDVAKRAISLAMEGVSDTQGPGERQALAAELDTVLKQAVEIGNTSNQGNYLFAGFKTTTPPFTLVDSNSDGEYDSVTYNGDAGVILRNIGPGQSITQNVNGDAAFSPLFAAIISARDALNSGDKTAIQTALGQLQSASDNLNGAITTNGARQRQVQAAMDRIGKTQTELKSLLSQKEDVNMAEAISQLSNQETVYQAVLEVGKRAISVVNLFDLMG